MIATKKSSSTGFRFPFRWGLVVLTAVELLFTADSALGQAPYFFFTLAGKAGSTGATNLPGAAARFNGPYGVAVDTLGNVYVADTANDAIREIALNGAVSTLAGIVGTNGSTNGLAAIAEFNLPTGVAVDNSGAVYVADWGNDTIRKISSGQVTTLAGLAGKAGWADGDGSIAQFNHPAALAVDASGYVYVADQGNDAIRMVTPDGVVSTLAGLPGVAGSGDGVGTNAQFNLPSGVGLNAGSSLLSGGNLFVADSGNDTIREITYSGEKWTVSTLAGSPGVIGTNDLTGAAARFNSPVGVAVGGSGGYVVVSDFGNDTVRFVTLAGQVTTQAGSPDTSGATGGPGIMTLFNWPAGIAFDAYSNIYVAESGNSVIREGSPVTGPLIVGQPQSQTSVPDGDATFTVVAMGLQPLTYQWKLDNEDLPNAVTPSVDITGLEPGDGGTITVEVVSPYGSVTSSNASLIVAQPDSFITVAGSPTNTGFADGAGADALFDFPGAVATDTNGNIFVADSYNDTIREIIPSGLTDCTVKTIAGSSVIEGFADGEGTNAYFDTPYGVWVDTNENVWVADSFNYVIREIKFDGTNWDVTTLAGRPETPGTNDGVGTNGLFGLPVGLTIGLAGNIFVADYDNYELRQVTPDGDVSTLTGSELISGGETAGEGTYGLSSTAGITSDAAGNLYVADDDNNQIFKVSTNEVTTNWDAVNYAGMASDYGGTNDGPEGLARFNEPQDVAGDNNTNYYVADTGNNTIRKIAPDQSVSTVGGVPGMAGWADGTGTNALFNEPLGLVVDPNGIVYVADSRNNVIRKQLPDLLIAVQPQAQSVHVNSNATFNVVAASTSDLTYQWLMNGKVISDENDSSLTISGAQSGNAGSYSVVVSNATQGTTSMVATLTVQIPPIIVSGPQTQIVTNGAKVTFSVYSIGTGPLSYQWLHNGVPRPGQMKTNLVVAAVSTNDLGYYALAVNGPAGDTVSTNALLALSGQTNPIITWTNPAPIIYGTALTSNQLNATANVAGSFAYTPTNGTVLNAGTNTLSVVFTPTDTVDYSTAMDTVSLVVLPAAPVIQTAKRSGSSITLTWSAFANQMYQIQSTTNLHNWTNSGGTITASNSTVTVSLPIGVSLDEYYRIVLLP
jgi:hypothetical protein